MIAVGLIIGVLGVGTAQALVTPENMYDVNMIHTFYIQMDATDYQDMRFSAGDNYGEGPGLVFPDPVTGQYEWWQAYLGQSPTDPNIIPVAIRRKSAPALPSEADPQKFSIKVDIHKPPYTPPGQRFGGKKKLSLECGSAGSLVSEGLAWYIYNAAGVVSCYSNWVKVYMSTDLGQNWTYMGLYINLEQIDNEFLEDHMPNRHDYGFLYQRTETIGEIKETRETESNPFEFSWYPFDHPTYMSETIPPPTDWLTQTPQRVDMNQLMKFAVLENFVYNQDGTINKGNNYYYYDWATNPTDPNLMDPNYKQPRMYFPWDLDTCMIGSATGPLIDDRNGNFVESLIKEEQENGTPYGYHTYQEDYYTTYRSLLDGPLATANMQALITTIQNAIGAEINADPLSEVTSPTEFDRLRTYVANRWTYIDAQLDAMLPLPGTSLLNDGFEGAPWNTNWNNVASTWTDETVIVHSGSHAAGADRGGGTGYFTSDALDASDATAIYIRFYFQKKSAATFTVEFYGSGGWSTPINLIPLGGDNEWLVYTNTITNSSYFVSDFKIRFNAAFSGGGTRSVEVDDVEITKTLPAVQYTITASSGANGYVDPNGAVVKDQGSSQLFTASANTGYEVDQWLLDSSPVQTGGTTYTLTNITANHTVNVTFKLSGVTQYTITASSGANGYIDPNGAVVKNQGENQLFTASANTGYEVDTWYMDSSPVQTGGTTYTITNIQANHTLNVTFKQLQYTITASSGANGYVDPNGAVIKNYGSSQLFTASANTGYEVDQWLLDSSPVQTGGTTYNLTNITANHTLNVTFKQLQYTITASYGANGTVDPNGAIVKNYGEDQLFTASANTGYEVDQWLLDSSPVQTGGTTYNLTNITANHTLNVTFKQLQYTVTASSGANGYVDPNGAIVKNYGEDQLFTASANTGYEVDQWLLDSSPVQTGGTTYNLTNITANHTLNVTFKQLQYTITASYGANGTVDPNGAIVKNYGEDQLFTASANIGYMVDTWYLDGNNVQLGGTTYTLTNIQSAHTVNVTFTILPADNFDDNTQSALWQTYEDSANNTWLRDFEEANQRLQLQAISQITSYKAYLLGHYKMNDNDANTRVLDSSGNGKDGVAARNTSLLHTTGQIDGALTFNGTADSIRTNIVMGGAYTKVAWIKRGPDIIGEYNSIISSDTSAHTLWAPRYRGYKLSAGHNTNRTIVEDPAAITAGVWYFVAVTFDPLLDSGRMVLYKNGAPVSTATSVATPVASSNTFIGKWGGSYLFNGAIDNVMLFNRALTADEIATIYNGGAGTETLPDDIYLESETMATSTVGHWKLNDNDANTRVLDASGNGNNGTAQQNTSVLHTTGKLDGALAFDGATDYINLGSVVGTGAYTKVAWVKRDAGDYYNSILSSDNSSHVLWAPYDQSFKLSAGHNASGYLVQDTASLNPDLWYCVAVTYNPAVHSGLMVLYKDGVQVDSATSVAAQAASTATCVGRYGAGSYFKGAVDNVMVFDRALTAQEIAILYNGGSGTETIPSDHFYAAYLANGWQFDVSEDFQVKIDVHYSALSSNDGWMGITIEKAGDPDNYVSLSAGTAANQPYFFYEKLVDGSPVTAQQARASNDGALYVSYDSALDQLYVSSTGYGSANAWQTVSGLLQGQWASESLALYIGGGSDRSLILPGQAYLDNLVIDQAALLNWPILADLNGDGFIDFLDVKEFADNWLLSTGPDLNDDGIVDFFDFTLFNQGW